MISDSNLSDTAVTSIHWHIPILGLHVIIPWSPGSSNDLLGFQSKYTRQEGKRNSAWKNGPTYVIIRTQKCHNYLAERNSIDLAKLAQRKPLCSLLGGRTSTNVHNISPRSTQQTREWRNNTSNEMSDILPASQHLLSWTPQLNFHTQSDCSWWNLSSRAGAI
jgi:hypothetical protein